MTINEEQFRRSVEQSLMFGNNNPIYSLDPINSIDTEYLWQDIRRVDPRPYNPPAWQADPNRGIMQFIDTYGAIRSNEDTIKEKKMSDNKNNLENLVTGNEIQKPKEPIKISIKGLIEDINNGLTRLKGDTGYNEKVGSIEEKYGIAKSDVREIFKNSQLVNLRVKPVKEKAYELIDDVTVENVEETTSTETEKVIFGKASEATVKEIAKNTVETTTEELEIPF